MNVEKDNNKNYSKDVQFQNVYKPPRYEQKAPKMIQWVIKYSGGLIKNEKQAQYVFLGFVVLAIIISLFLFFGGGMASRPGDIKILPAEI